MTNKLRNEKNEGNVSPRVKLSKFLPDLWNRGGLRRYYPYDLEGEAAVFYASKGMSFQMDKDGLLNYTDPTHNLIVTGYPDAEISKTFYYELEKIKEQESTFIISPNTFPLARILNEITLVNPHNNTDDWVSPRSFLSLIDSYKGVKPDVSRIDPNNFVGLYSSDDQFPNDEMRVNPEDIDPNGLNEFVRIGYELLGLDSFEGDCELVRIAKEGRLGFRNVSCAIVRRNNQERY